MNVIILSATLHLSFYAAAQASDIVALWPFTESSQAQSVSFGETIPRGVITNCVFEKGRSGNDGGCINLRSSPNSHVAIVSKALQIPGDFSIFAWVKLAAACQGAIFQWIHPLTRRDAPLIDHGANLRMSDRKLVFGPAGFNAVVVSSTALDIGQWTRVGVIVKPSDKTVQFIVGAHTETPKRWVATIEKVDTSESVNIGSSLYTKNPFVLPPRTPKADFQGNMFCLQLWKIALDGEAAIDAAFQRCEPLDTRGLVALWPLDYKRNLLDISANRLPRGIGSNVGFDSGPFCNTAGSINVRGSSDSYVEFTHANLNPSSGTFTILTMIKPLDNNFGALFEWYEPKQPRGAHLFVEYGKLLYNPSSTGSVALLSTAKFTQNQWSTVAVTYDATAAKGSFYINGEMDPLREDGAVPKPITYKTVRVGVAGHESDDGSGRLKARVACIQLWNRSLTVQEIPLAFHKCVTCCNAPAVSVPVTTEKPTPLSTEKQTLFSTKSTEKPTALPTEKQKLPTPGQSKACDVTECKSSAELTEYIPVFVAIGVGGVLLGGLVTFLAFYFISALRIDYCKSWK